MGGSRGHESGRPIPRHPGEACFGIKSKLREWFIPAALRNGPSGARRWPLFSVALLHAVGILAGAWWPPPLAVGFGVCVFFAATVFVDHRRGALWLACLAVSAGWFHLATRTMLLSPRDLRELAPPGPVLASVRGTLARSPVERRYEDGKKVYWSTRVPIRLQAVQLGAGWLPIHGKVMARFRGRLPPRFFSGQSVEVSGVLKPPPAAVQFGMFDYGDYLDRLGISRLLETDRPGDWRLGRRAEAGPPLSRRFQDWARKALVVGMPETDTAVRLLYAMVLGWKTALNGEIAEPFMLSGTMHIFAISGLHIALVAGIWIHVCRFLQIPRNRSWLVVVPMLWAYAAVTGCQPSAVRATVMMSVIVLGWAWKRPHGLINSVGAAALMILLYDPRQLFQAGFQLSFTVVFSLATVGMRIRTLIRNPWHDDPLLPPELQPRWRRRLAEAWHRGWGGFAASASAWLGSMPLVAAYFHLVTPISVFVNLLIVPLAGLTLISAMGSLLTAAWLPSWTACFNHSAWFWMQVMIRISAEAARVPGGHFHAATPAWPAFLLYYILLAAFAAGWLFRSRRACLLPALVLLGLAAAALVQSSLNRRLKLFFLPAAGGSVVLADVPRRSGDLLIDCGNLRACRQVTHPFLRAQGWNRIPNFLLTHGDARQIAGEPYLAERYAIENYFTSDHPFRSPYFRRFVERLGKSETPRRKVHAGNQAAGWNILHPRDGDAYSRADDAATVLWREWNGWRILLLSDLGRAGQNALLKRYPELRADIVVTGLPSADEPVRDLLLNQLAPEVVVVTDSASAAGRFVARAVRERLANHPFRVFYTSETGGLRLEISSTEIRLDSPTKSLWHSQGTNRPIIPRDEAWKTDVPRHPIAPLNRRCDPAIGLPPHSLPAIPPPSSAGASPGSVAANRWIPAALAVPCQNGQSPGACPAIRNGYSPNKIGSTADTPSARSS